MSAAQGSAGLSNHRFSSRICLLRQPCAVTNHHVVCSSLRTSWIAVAPGNNIGL